jgi:hypothetical protein
MFNDIADRLRAVVVKQEHFVSLGATVLTERGRLSGVSAALTAAATNAAAAAGANGSPSDVIHFTDLRLALLAIETTGPRFLASPNPAMIPTFRMDAAAAKQALSIAGASDAATVKTAAQLVAPLLESYVVTFEKVFAAIIEGDSLFTGQIKPELRDMQSVTSSALGKLIKGFSSTSQKAYNLSSDTSKSSSDCRLRRPSSALSSHS